ncbi:acyl--CoA ligase [Streptomyces sp. RS10V-4]|uniref:class I adenylate-forming enzyme family protein n=1 Tax=Streptomyces rhizoryzae TaxID=2932493 RepID=UPI0020041A9E|nr:class I adenylate-forming enzyme family protein [Streptomyces rhizoryzae]MCK7624964.1 acyl--CoA ligase [Streptomyces rhizoryzae]
MLTRTPAPALGISRDDIVALLSRTTDLTHPEGADPGPAFDEALADLRRLDLAPGTPVIIALSNGTHLLRHYFAALLSGCVPLAVSPATSSARITALAEHLKAGALIAARIDPARYGADRVRPAGTEQAVPLPMGGPQGAYRPGEVLMLTSGTSGMFSACLHRLDSLLRNARRHSTAVGVRADDRLLISLPLYYSYAIVAQAMTALVTGAHLVLSGPPFNPAAYRATIERHRVTSSSITPTIARQLLELGTPLPAPLRSLAVGGDRLTPEHVAGLLDLNPGGELYVTYGLTEAGPRVATLAAHREPAHRHASVGRPLDDVTVALRDTGPDGVGELVVTTDTALLRKVGPSARQPLLAPGRVATGDLFRRDADGYLYYRGRLSDFVVVRGEKVSLYSIRQAAQTIPGVARAVPRVARDDDGENCVDLEIHASEPVLVTDAMVHDALRPLLMRSERPRRITVVPLAAAAQHK